MIFAYSFQLSLKEIIAQYEQSPENLGIDLGTPTEDPMDQDVPVSNTTAI